MVHSKLVLAIDQGTTGTTCILVDINRAGSTTVLGRGYAEFRQHFPQPGWVEHDLDDIWASTRNAIQQVLASTDTDGKNIAAIGITNQRETTGLWDPQGKPAHPAIVWQDRRTADHCQTLTQSGFEQVVRERTGLVIDPYFSATKLAWLLDQASLRGAAEKGKLRFGTIDAWLVFKLTGGASHVTDATNASRTLLYDIHRCSWDQELCDIMGKIPQCILPQVRTSSEVYGTTRGLDVLPDGIPIAGIAGDQQAALFGQACLTPGMAKCTYGTGAFVLVNTGSQAIQSKHKLITTIAWQLGDSVTYALEGSTFVAGAVVQWLRDGLGFFENSPEIEKLATQVPDTAGVVFVPALTGLGAPHWRPQARGMLCGLTRGTTPAHIARAALEGIAFQVHDLLHAMRQDCGKASTVLRVDGGASANHLLMQFQADILGVEIHRPAILETTALGAAYLAALGIGLISDLDEIAKGWTLERGYQPQMDTDKVQASVRRWRDAVGKV